MSDIKFTPGPWKVTDYRDIMDEDGQTFVGVSFRQSPAERRANAHLIAAAPELYEALKYVVTIFEHYADTPEEINAIGLALNVLGTAEGDEGVSARQKHSSNERCDLPEDIIESLLAIGPVEWGQTHTQTDGKHIDDLEDTLRLTREHFGIEKRETAIHGVYLAGSGVVLAHTGMSPNSPQHARILAGAWNQLVDIAKGEAGPTVVPTPTTAQDLGIGMTPKERDEAIEAYKAKRRTADEGGAA